MKPTQEFLDQILILRCQLRDRQAFAELIDRYQGPVRYFIVHSRTLTMHQIQSSLALIEEHLRKMSQKE